MRTDRTSSLQTGGIGILNRIGWQDYRCRTGRAIYQEEAYICFMCTGMDYLVMGDYLFRKDEKPPWEERNWKNEMARD